MASKIFEVGDVLPATTQLRISWENHTFTGGDYSYDFNLNQPTKLQIQVLDDYPGFVHIAIELPGKDTLYPSMHDMFCIVDTSSMSETDRTITNSESYFNDFTFEDVAIPQVFNITFNSNGGTTISDIEEATELPTLPTPTKSGYTFVAWYYESNFQTRAKAGDTIEANTTLYAKWHTLGSLFTEIANAIRSKDGTSGNIRDLDFVDRIRAIEGAKELTQAEYDALGTKDANTYYLIVEVE